MLLHDDVKSKRRISKKNSYRSLISCLQLICLVCTIWVCVPHFLMSGSVTDVCETCKVRFLDLNILHFFTLHNNFAFWCLIHNKKKKYHEDDFLYGKSYIFELFSLSSYAVNRWSVKIFKQISLWDLWNNLIRIGVLTINLHKNKKYFELSIKKFFFHQTLNACQYYRHRYRSWSQ